ncbi:MAG TPA: CdaR family protein, partial [Anaerolineae bacterium]|nr:CdaR family protein [Anaerolineae bacterium]
QTNPARQELFEGIPLRVENIPSGTTLLESPPATVSAQIQAGEDTLRNLRPSSFQAVVSLEGLQPGLHSLPIEINSGAPRVRVLNTEPAVLDVELAPIITRTLEVTIEMPDREKLSPAYRLVGAPFASPNQVQISGAAPLVEQVQQVRAEVLLNNATTSIRQTRPLQALNEAGREISGVGLQPSQAEITVLIEQQLNARDVGVRAVISGTPPDGYRLSSLTITPTNVTLQGNLGQLAEMDSYVDTLPIDISRASGDLTLQVPLVLPSDVQALDSSGNPIRTVMVQAEILPQSGYLQTTRRVELLGITSDITATVNPPTVDLIISGPSPILHQIETDPGLVQVMADVVGVDPPQSINRKLNVAAPDEIRVQVIPDSVQVTLLP